MHARPLTAWLLALVIVGAGVTTLLMGILYLDSETRQHEFFGIFVVGAVLLLATATSFALIAASPAFFALLALVRRTRFVRPAGDIVAGALAAGCAFVISPISEMQITALPSEHAIQHVAAMSLGACVGALYWWLVGKPNAAAPAHE